MTQAIAPLQASLIHVIVGVRSRCAAALSRSLFMHDGAIATSTSIPLLGTFRRSDRSLCLLGRSLPVQSSHCHGGNG
jgi:hypothetical protein